MTGILFLLDLKKNEENEKKKNIIREQSQKQNLTLRWMR